VRIRSRRRPFSKVSIRDQFTIATGVRGEKTQQPIARVRVCGISDGGRKGGE